jgi:hypothetical protein
MPEKLDIQAATNQGVGSFIRDKDGKVSSSRLLLITWGIGTFIVWAISSYQAKVLQAAIPNSALERHFSHFNKQIIDFILNKLR